MMVSIYEDIKTDKLKKNIKWYTYVDSFLDSKLKDFMEKYEITNQAKIIRNFVNYCIDYLHAIFQKKLNSDSQSFDEMELDSLIRKAIKRYEIGNGFHEELKQKLSPLKLSLLMLENYIDEKEKLRETIHNALNALDVLETSVKRHFEEPNIIRFVKKIDLLYIEDNDLERKTIDFYFKAKAVDIKSLETSDEALYTLKNVTPKAILLDLNLKTSKINGDRFCQILKTNSQYKSIPIIIISAAYSKKEKKEILAKTGAEDIIFKPINRLKDLNVIFKYLTQ